MGPEWPKDWRRGPWTANWDSCSWLNLVLGSANHIANAALGFDQRRYLVLVAVLILDDDAIDLLAKIGDVRFDDGRVPAPIVLPHVIENLRLGQHAAFIVHEVAKKLVFGGAQVDWPSGSGHVVRVLVDFEIAHTDDRIVLHLLLGATQDGADSGHDSSRLNGLVT